MTFYFSSTRSTDTLRRFRDGERNLPEYLAELMATIETELLTYDEAVALVNQQMLANHIGPTFESVISDHMREVRRDGNR